MIAAAEAGSLTAAAETLGITHGSVSRRIALLEAWLGTTLFERHGRGVRLTPAGQRFCADARHALGVLTRSADQWRPRRGKPIVRLATVPSFARLWLLPRLSELERGDIHIEVMMDHRPTDLDAQEADLAIRYGRGQWQGLDAQLLFGETLRPVAAPKLVAAILPRGNLLQFPLLHDSDVSHWRDWLRLDGMQYRPRSQDRRFEDYDSVLVAAEAGLGIAMLREPLVSQTPVAKKLVSVSERILKNPAGHYLCRRIDEQRSGVLELAGRIILQVQ
jgi:LysR family transcriptional regulator, glycine cleavage system transcriptional activator